VYGLICKLFAALVSILPVIQINQQDVCNIDICLHLCFQNVHISNAGLCSSLFHYSTEQQDVSGINLCVHLCSSVTPALQNVRIGNAGLKALTQLKDLEVLNLNITSVTYRAKGDLMTFKVCRFIDLKGDLMAFTVCRFID